MLVYDASNHVAGDAPRDLDGASCLASAAMTELRPLVGGHRKAEKRRETPRFFSEFAVLMGRAKNSTVFVGRLCAANKPRNIEKRTQSLWKPSQKGWGVLKKCTLFGLYSA
jgi:hypothetical protein